jgi:hypothetical protein
LWREARAKVWAEKCKLCEMGVNSIGWESMAVMAKKKGKIKTVAAGFDSSGCRDPREYADFYSICQMMRVPPLHVPWLFFFFSSRCRFGRYRLFAPCDNSTPSAYGVFVVYWWGKDARRGQ